LTTAKEPFRVDDINHKWEKLTNEQLVLYWYNGGQNFGKALFDRAIQTSSFLARDTNVTVDQQVQIFIYATHSDMMEAVDVASPEWLGGLNLPRYGVVIVNVSPSSLEWGKGAVSHELTHQIIHQRVRSSIGETALPHWMDEGLAVYYQNQDPGTADPQFAAAVAEQRISGRRCRYVPGIWAELERGEFYDSPIWKRQDSKAPGRVQRGRCVRCRLPGLPGG
jgi:hypothetical protein